MLLLSGSLFIINLEAAVLPDFSELIEKTSPAVVKITAVSHPQQSQRRQLPNNQMQDIPEIFRELLEQQQRPRERGSLGSGFIISADGYVLTNNHVVSEADEIKVVMSDRREFIATVVGVDAGSDLALLKIDGKNLPQLALAKNEKLKVGQWVVAIGSPFGLDYSASAGIVSAIGRNIDSESHQNTYVPFIQTDVAINPGNSGGPLFNMDGEVVGINSQIFSPSGGSVGLSFAIPSSVALDVVAQLREKGHVDRGWLGVVIQSVDKDMASAYGLERAQGAQVAEVAADGPAAKAGVKDGDLIVKFNGQDINTSSDLPHVVGRIAPGTKVAMDVIRKGKREVLNVTVGKLPVRDTPEIRTQLGEQKQTKTDVLGLSVTSVNDGKVNGVQIVAIEPDSAAARAGLARGDVITQLDFVDIDSLATYNKTVSSLPKNVPKAIRFLRNGTPVFRSITLK
jgi:serine protease Do